MWSAYMRLLKAYPVRANIATAAIVTAGGDALAQQLAHYYPDRLGLDFERSAIVTAYWAGTSPALFTWFRWLDSSFPTQPATKGRLLNLGKKLCMHQWTFVPLVNGLFFTYLICAEHTLHDARPQRRPSQPRPQVDDRVTAERLRREQRNAALRTQLAAEVPSQLWETQKTSVVVWGVAHTFNFLFLPNHTRVLFNSPVGVLWSAYMSTVGHRD